jgi:hypothetical protein
MTIDKNLIWKTIRGAFPDPAVEITELVVDLAIRAMQASWRKEYQDAFGVEPLPEGSPDVLLEPVDLGPVDAPDGPVYYIGHAVHRRASPITHQFHAHLPHVRVQLPDGGAPEIKTLSGIVYAGDHLLYNVGMVRDYVEEQELLRGGSFTVNRVDVITPARFAGARFGAIAIYLLYAHSTDAAPWGYILEAGMATGQPRTLYFSPGWRVPVVRRSFYQPTPDSSPKNFYRGRLYVVDPKRATAQTRAIGGDPYQLRIESFRTNPMKDDKATPYHGVTVTYERVAQPSIVFPALLTLQAACRVALIEETMGRELPDIGPLTGVLAELGRQLPWDNTPSKET